jgi:OOP family OmpA-OmpF porin
MKRLHKASAAALGTVVVAILVSGSAGAADSGWYIGANAGQSRANIDDPAIMADLLDAGLTTTAITDDDRHFGFKAFGGYQFNRFLALESGYFDLGKFSFQASTSPAGTLRGEIEIHGVNLDLVGFVPFTEKFAAFGRVGAIYAEAEDSFTATGAVNVLDPNRRKRAANYKFGLGLQYNFFDEFGMRAEAERYRIDDAVGNDGDIDLVSVGFVFRFGGGSGPARVAAEPLSVMTPMAVTVPVPETGSDRTQKYCSILDFQFEVNKDDIQREEKEKLAVIGTFLNKYPETSAVIEGHTDNVGPPEQNLRLSRRRADSVVSYLVDTLHVAPARLSAVGYGDTRPLGDNRTEEGKRMNRRIGAVVACATDIEGLRVAPARLTMALAIEFDGQDATVRPEYREELRKLAEFLKANPSLTATVEGHTGALQATPEMAMRMSKLRAQNVVNYLVGDFGIDRSRLTAEGFGRTRRFAYNTTLDGQQENRRVNVIINYPK